MFESHIKWSNLDVLKIEHLIMLDAFIRIKVGSLSDFYNKSPNNTYDSPLQFLDFYKLSSNKFFF